MTVSIGKTEKPWGLHFKGEAPLEKYRESGLSLGVSSPEDRAKREGTKEATPASRGSLPSAPLLVPKVQRVRNRR